MRSQAFLFSTLLALAGGCHHSKHSEPGDGGVDAGPTEPEAKLVSPASVAVGLVTDATNQHALYIANPVAPTSGHQSGGSAHGVLHLVDEKGTDSLVSVTGATTNNVAVGGYIFSPDGKYVLYGELSSDNFSSNLTVAPVSAPTTGTVIVPTNDLYGSYFSQIGFFTTDSHYFVFADDDQGLYGSQSLLVLDLQVSPPAIVYEVKNGGFDGVQSLANGILYYNALSSDASPIITLYGVPLAGITKTTVPKTIAQRVATFSTSTDGTTAYYITGSGDVFSQGVDSSGAKGAAVQITPVAPTTGIPGPPSATTFALEPCKAEPCRVAWVSPEGALHVSVGTVEVYKTAAGTIDLNSTVTFTSDGSVFFFQYVKSQESRGILYFADLSSLPKTPTAATSTSTPTPVFGTVTGPTDPTYDSKATYLYSVISEGGSTFLAQVGLPPAASAYGTVYAPLVHAGPTPTTLGTGVPSGDLLFGGGNIAFLANGADDKASAHRANGGQNYGGTLELSVLDAVGTSVMAAPTDVVANGNYEFSDDNSDLVFIETTVATTGVLAFSTSGLEYVGTLHVHDLTGSAADHVIAIPGAASSATVTQIGPITGRGGFFTATPVEATAQGVYHLTY